MAFHIDSHKYPHAMTTILSKFLFNLSYRVATARFCFSRAKAFPPNAGIYTNPNDSLGQVDESDRAALSDSRFWTQAICVGSDATDSYDAAMVGYSDPAMEEALHDVPMLLKFAEEDVIPGETTILKFHHLL